MAWSVTTGAATMGTVDQAARTCLVTLAGSYSYDPVSDGAYGAAYMQWGLLGAYTNQGPTKISTGLLGFEIVVEPNTYTVSLGSTNGAGYTIPSALEADRTYQYRGRIDVYSEGFSGSEYERTRNGSLMSAKTNAVTGTASAPTSSGVTSVAATIACNYFPNTYESTCSVQLQYKRNVDPGWTNAGVADAGKTGYAELNISRGLTGLTPATLYDVRLVVTRTTNNGTTVTSATSQFTTLTAAATITTDAATALTAATATLNGTVNPNGVATTYYFEYGTTVAYGTTTAAQGPNSGSAAVAFSQGIVGLTANTVYHYRAVADQGGTLSLGADATFSTDNQGHIMPTVYQYLAKYGTQTTFRYCVETPASTGSDQFLSAAVPWIAGDVTISKDGGAFANVGTLPSRLGSTPLYELTLTATEMQATEINVILRDAAGGPLWRDCHLQVKTKLLLGQIDVDATQIGGNTHAMSLVGVGTGYGLFAKGSSGIRGEAQGTSGHGIAGVGIGPGQGFYGGFASGGRPCNFFHETMEGAEPVVGDLANDMSVIKNLQVLRRRHTNKITQTTGTQTWYKDDSATVLKARTVSDDLTTQTQAKLF